MYGYESSNFFYFSLSCMCDEPINVKEDLSSDENYYAKLDLHLWEFLEARFEEFCCKAMFKKMYIDIYFVEVYNA